MMFDSAQTIDEHGTTDLAPAKPKSPLNDTAVRALTEVAEWLERGGDAHKGVGKFNMTSWQNCFPSECGTVCCIGGAVGMFNRLGNDGSGYADSENVIKFLGIREHDALRLFIPSPDRDGVYWRVDYISPAWAARTVRHYIATGVVDWRGNQ